MLKDLPLLFKFFPHNYVNLILNTNKTENAFSRWLPELPKGKFLSVSQTGAMTTKATSMQKDSVFYKNTHGLKSMKSSHLLGPFWDLEFWKFFYWRLRQVGCYDIAKFRIVNSRQLWIMHSCAQTYILVTQYSNEVFGNVYLSAEQY